jgi:ketosteroid isomerase-like protein
MKTIVLLSVFVLLIGSTVIQAQSNPSKKENVAAAKATVSGLAAADVESIRKASRTFVATALARDWPKWTALFTDDAINFSPGEPVIVGRKAIETWINKFPKIKSLTVEPIEFQGFGELAFVRGNYAMTTTAQNKPDTVDTGKYIELWRRQSNGSWKIFRDIFNSDLPQPAPKADAALARATALKNRPAPLKLPGVGSLSVSDQDAIRAAWKNQTDAARAKDWAKVASFFSTDTARLSPNEPIHHGRSEVVASWQNFPPYRDWIVEPLEIGGSGDFAYVRGHWSIVVLPPGGAEKPDAGKYVQIWKRTGGTWQFFRDIWNSDLP